MDPPHSRDSGDLSFHPHQSSNASSATPSIADTTDTIVEDQYELQQIPTRPISGLSHASQPQLSAAIRTCSTVTRDPSFEVDWEENDPENPLIWPLWYKGYIVFSLSFSTLVTILYSTSYTSATHALKEEYDVASDTTVTLGLTTYLCGLALGALFMAPLSETFGRRPIFMISMVIFTALIIPCARATSLAEIIVVRFFGALAGSSMIGSAPGSVGELFTADRRALAFSVWSIGPFNGPVIGPLIGGFVTENLGWRWSNWIVLILGGIAAAMMFTIRETYPPVLLQRKAAALRKSTGENRYWSRYDQRLEFIPMMKTNLSRPFIMAVKEPICIFWNIYIGIIYGILYLCFVAYPFVFQGVRKWSLGLSGLAFLGIGIGSLITIGAEPLIRRWINSHKPEPGSDKPAPEVAIGIVCVAAVVCPVGVLIFAWTCVPASIHWAFPIAAGIPFGAGNTAVFIYATNYLVCSYGVYAASAMASNSMVRSVLGGVLPLAGAGLYKKLGANWAGTVLASMQIAILPIPFVFYRYGRKIRMKSSLIRMMREDQEKAEKKRAKARPIPAEATKNQTAAPESETGKQAFDV